MNAHEYTRHRVDEIDGQLRSRRWASAGWRPVRGRR